MMLRLSRLRGFPSICGWAHTPKGGRPGNSEPFSCETGFAVK
jgi:hypothetical protein